MCTSLDVSQVKKQFTKYRDFRGSDSSGCIFFATNTSFITGLQSQQQPGGERSFRNGQEEVAARAPETRDGGEDAQARQGEDQVSLTSLIKFML